MPNTAVALGNSSDVMQIPLVGHGSATPDAGLLLVVH
jgi:hypothetical protein